MRPSVKICGLTRTQDVEMCTRHGADMLGFVVEYPRPVPWNLSVSEATRLIAKCEAKTCVVTGGSAEKTLTLAHTLKPDFMQLHDCDAKLYNELRSLGVGVIATLRPGMANFEQAAADFCAAGVHALLLDPRDAASGGTANVPAFLWLKRIASRPVVLAGGISPENVAEIIRQARPEMIDLMTGVEQRPGIKDEKKVRALFGVLD